MATKYNRTNFLTKIKVDGTNEYDLVSNNLNKFKFSRKKSYYKVTQEDIQRPDLVAIKVLLIPNEKDIEDFFIFNRSQQNAST
jgi:hypothetical protein